MDRRRLLRSLAPAAGVLAGCTDLDVGATATATPGQPEYDVYVFDHSDLDGAVLEGGVAFREEFERVRYVALLTDDDRFRMDRLRAADEGAAAFVSATDFGASVLVVYQEFPLSSVPDYEVTRVRRDGETLRIAIDDASDYGTDDVTVETVLVRVARGGTAPRRAVVTTEEGVSVSSGE